jgi:hypothetical protein
MVGGAEVADLVHLGLDISGVNEERIAVSARMLADLPSAAASVPPHKVVEGRTPVLRDGQRCRAIQLAPDPCG